MGVEFHPGTRKRIMRNFKITEISSVDRPAMEPALATLMKRRDDKAAPASFEEAVAMLKADGLSTTRAMSRARDEHPALFAKYQAAGIDAVKKAAAPPQTPDAVAAFNKAVAQVRREQRCSATEAMSIVRRDEPELFKRYQAA